MGYIEWANKAIKKMSVWDVKFIKWSVFFFTLWIAFVYAPLTEWLQGINVWIFLGLGILLMVKPLHTIFKK